MHQMRILVPMLKISTAFRVLVFLNRHNMGTFLKIFSFQGIRKKFVKLRNSFLYLTLLMALACCLPLPSARLLGNCFGRAFIFSTTRNSAKISEFQWNTRNQVNSDQLLLFLQSIYLIFKLFFKSSPQKGPYPLAYPTCVSGPSLRVANTRLRNLV